MYGTLVDKVASFFDKRFMVVYWLPAFTFFLLIGGSILIVNGYGEILKELKSLDVITLVLLGIGCFVAITFLALILVTISDPLASLYQGNWSEGRVKRIAIALEKRKMLKIRRYDRRRELSEKHQKLMDKRQELTIRQQELQKDNTKSNIEPDTKITEELNSIEEQLILIAEEMAKDERLAYSKSFINFPRNLELLKPTRLGNVLMAANEYSYQVYRIDTYIWWPKIAPLLPDQFRNQVDESLAPMQTLLNLCTIFIVFALAIAIALPFERNWPIMNWSLFAILYIFILLLTRICYQLAIYQANNYGLMVRVAFDYYRQDILKQMHIPLPDNIISERILWETLSHWHYFYIPPWEINFLDPDVPLPDNPFYFDTHFKSKDGN